MRARMKLDKLEQKAKQHYETLRLLDGTVVNYTSEDVLGALSAAIAGEGHWLIPFLRQVDTTTGLPGLIKALVVSWEKNMGEGVLGELQATTSTLTREGRRGRRLDSPTRREREGL